MLRTGGAPELLLLDSTEHKELGSARDGSSSRQVLPPFLIQWVFPASPGSGSGERKTSSASAVSIWAWLHIQPSWREAGVALELPSTHAAVARQGLTGGGRKGRECATEQRGEERQEGLKVPSCCSYSVVYPSWCLWGGWSLGAATPASQIAAAELHFLKSWPCQCVCACASIVFLSLRCFWRSGCPKSTW